MRLCLAGLMLLFLGCSGGDEKDKDIDEAPLQGSSDIDGSGESGETPGVSLEDVKFAAWVMQTPRGRPLLNLVALGDSVRQVQHAGKVKIDSLLDANGQPVKIDPDPGTYQPSPEQAMLSRGEYAHEDGVLHSVIPPAMFDDDLVALRFDLEEMPEEALTKFSGHVVLHTGTIDTFSVPDIIPEEGGSVQNPVLKQHNIKVRVDRGSVVTFKMEGKDADELVTARLKTAEGDLLSTFYKERDETPDGSSASFRWQRRERLDERSQLVAWKKSDVEDKVIAFELKNLKRPEQPEDEDDSVGEPVEFTTEDGIKVAGHIRWERFNESDRFELELNVTGPGLDQTIEYGELKIGPVKNAAGEEIDGETAWGQNTYFRDVKRERKRMWKYSHPDDGIRAIINSDRSYQPGETIPILKGTITLRVGKTPTWNIPLKPTAGEVPLTEGENKVNGSYSVGSFDEVRVEASPDNFVKAELVTADDEIVESDLSEGRMTSFTGQTTLMPTLAVANAPNGTQLKITFVKNLNPVTLPFDLSEIQIRSAED